MRYLTNDYRDSQILNLGAENEPGPYIVTQTGVDPRAELPKTHMFVLRPDGYWADFNAYASRLEPEAMDEIVFGKITDVMATFARLSRAPQIVHLPVDEEGLKTWLQRQEGRPPLEAARSWAVNYRVRQQSRS